ncbi:hypothetical protein PSTT_12209 [Puccinia striiformis]|uniref:Uncharacterized protein n=1 Tax=Puccinia striiformis TaxID=27350 RepID=A0A2S4UXF9_9BASI|nr:hypothetical protein PSTT_12209 [Puccinia striiformis]
MPLSPPCSLPLPSALGQSGCSNQNGALNLELLTSTNCYSNGGSAPMSCGNQGGDPSGSGILGGLLGSGAILNVNALNTWDISGVVLVPKIPILTSIHKMQQEGPLDLVARIVSSFRSNNADGKSPEEYQEIFRHIIGHLHGRVSFARCWGMSDVLELPDDTAYRLGQIILPALKGKLRSVALVLNPLNWNNDGKSWYEPVLNDLIEIDEVLEQIVLSMGSAHPENEFVDIAPFSVRSVSRRVFHLCGIQLSRIFVAWQSFFEDFSFSNPPSYNLSCTPHGYHVAMLTATSTESIDTFIERLHKPLSAVAKDEWRVFVQQLSSSFNSFLEDRMDRLSPFLENYWESLLEENDPDVDREAIAHARQWHESWKQLFSIATDNFLRDTGCKKSRPTGVQWCFLNTMCNSLWKSNSNITAFQVPVKIQG